MSPVRLLRAAPDHAPRVLAWALALMFVYPLALMLLESFQAPGARSATRALFSGLPTLESWRLAFDSVPLARSLFNSLAVALLALPPTLAIAAMGGFALTQISRRGQALAVLLLLLAASIPLTAVWIPRFVMFESLGLVGTWVPLIAPALAGGSPVLVLLYFLALRRVPAELVEAARLEGLGWLRILWQVMLPLVWPTTVAVGLLAFVQVWGNFMEAVLYLKSPLQQTAPLMLHSLSLMGPTQWTLLMAGACAVTAPVVLAFLLLQRFLVANEREGSWSGR
ncbi:MAG: carbohydrate ABC transporter permease [Pseudomonadota bacterium]